MAAVFSRVPLPEVGTESDATEEDPQKVRSLWQHRNFKFGILVLMLYVAAQTGVNSFFINYTTDPAVGISTTTATLLLAFGCMGLFMVGRLCGSWLMSRIRAERILTFCALGATLATFLILLTGGMIGTVALFFVYLFVPHHLRPLYPRTGQQADETSQQLSHHEHRGWRSSPHYHGLHRRAFRSGSSFHRPPHLLHRHPAVWYEI